MTGANMTPAFMIFTDFEGNMWKALAFIAPLKSKNSELIHISDTEDLQLKLTKIRIVVGGESNSISG